MKLEDVLAALHEDEALKVFQPHWDESEASLGPELPFFLQPDQVSFHSKWCGFGTEAETALQEAACHIARNPALLHLAWHCYRLLYEHTDYNRMVEWPTLEAALGELGGAFYILVTMAMIPRVLAVHRSMGVPEDVTRDTCLQVSCVAGNYARMTGGRLGVTLNTIYWMRHYPAGRLFRLGRMEYKIEPYHGGVEVYRRRASGDVIALAPDGVRFNGAGYVDGAGGVFDEKCSWTSTLTYDDEAVTGYPISPAGMAVRHRVRLPLAEWERVLAKGDLILDMHIPAGGGMTPEKCGDSLRRGVDFFRRFFPDKPFRAVTCVSWIFNTQLEEIELSSDNLVRFQRELYLYPVPSTGSDGLWFIFLSPSVDPATAPRDTSLRCAVADFLAAGNIWRGGGMFFLTEHLDRFGTQYYRSHWPPPGLGL